MRWDSEELAVNGDGNGDDEKVDLTMKIVKRKMKKQQRRMTLRLMPHCGLDLMVLDEMRERERERTEEIILI